MMYQELLECSKIYSHMASPNPSTYSTEITKTIKWIHRAVILTHLPKNTAVIHSSLKYFGITIQMSFTKIIEYLKKKWWQSVSGGKTSALTPMWMERKEELWHKVFWKICSSLGRSSCFKSLPVIEWIHFNEAQKYIE